MCFESLHDQDHHNSEAQDSVLTIKVFGMTTSRLRAEARQGFSNMNVESAVLFYGNSSDYQHEPVDETKFGEFTL